MSATHSDVEASLEEASFVYQDTDTYQNEISEIYSYSEETDFFANRNAFEESMEDCGLPLAWKHMVHQQQSKALNYLLTAIEVNCRTTRMKSCRALAYIIQGNFEECLTLDEQAKNSQSNVFMLYPQGIFQSFVQQLLIEADHNPADSYQTQTGISSAQSFTDSSELRLVLSVLCTITETMYHAKDSTDPNILDMRNQFIEELQVPYRDELLVVILFQMLNKSCGANLTVHYPVKKITLLLWKIILMTLGGTHELRNLKAEKRKLAGLSEPAENTLDVVKKMQPTLINYPQVNEGPARSRAALMGGLAANKRKVFKQPAIDDAVYAYAKEYLLNCLSNPNQEQSNIENDNENEGENENEVENENENGNEGANENENQETGDDTEDLFIDYVNPPLGANLGVFNLDNIPKQDTATESVPTDTGIVTDDADSCEPKPDFDIYEMFSSNDHESPKTKTVSQPLTKLDYSQNYKGLPWSPKVKQSDLVQHVSALRQKFLGYLLQDDLETTFGLPEPIIEGINVLKRHLYVSLSEAQLEREELMERLPLTSKEIDPNYREAPAERLYIALLPRLPQYVIALLKILLAASTNAKSKAERCESINLTSELCQEDGTIEQRLKMHVDAARHSEIIIKSVSATLLLLLKHFKLNHVYQFEYISQQLMFANCIPLILKFLSQDIHKYIVASKSNIPAIDFPACVIGEQPELTSEAIELCSYQNPYSWRNLFSCLNLVMVLNKLIKWRYSRIMMLVVFKSAPTLSKALTVKHPMFQLYVLKLLKVQLKFLGRPWKKNNMKLISAIYQKVRHRLTDDWAYNNDTETRPWDFQAEEFTLQASINKFHQRRYQNLLNPVNLYSGSASAREGKQFYPTSCKFDKLDDLDKLTDNLEFSSNTLGPISPHFGQNYEKWLENEVFRRSIDWESLY